MAEPREINYAGGQKIFNKELTEQKIEDAVSVEKIRATSEESRIKDKINSEAARAIEAETDLNDKLATEIMARENGDEHLNNKIGDIDSLETETKDNTVAAINELVGKQTELTERLDDTLPYDDEPIKDSEKGVKSNGIFDAIRFASVKVGETMFWPVSEKETREVVSDNPFTFRFKGKDYTVEPVTPDTVDLIISKGIPDGWHALDGSAELEAAEHPDLAAFMPDNVTNDGKIWLPYVRQKIIKVKY